MVTRAVIAVVRILVLVDTFAVFFLNRSFFSIAIALAVLVVVNTGDFAVMAVSCLLLAIPPPTRPHPATHHNETGAARYFRRCYSCCCGR